MTSTHIKAAWKTFIICVFIGFALSVIFEKQIQKKSKFDISMECKTVSVQGAYILRCENAEAICYMKEYERGISAPSCIRK